VFATVGVFRSKLDCFSVAGKTAARIKDFDDPLGGREVNDPCPVLDRLEDCVARKLAGGHGGLLSVLARGFRPGPGGLD